MTSRTQTSLPPDAPTRRLDRPHRIYLRSYGGDPLAVLAIDWLKLSPAGAALVMLVLMAVVDGVTFGLMGWDILALFGWMDRWAYGVYSYVVTPLVAAAYIWVSTAPAQMFFALGNSDVLATSEEDYNVFVVGPARSLRAVYTHPGWSIASLIVVTLLAVYYLLFYTNTAAWPSGVLLLRAVKVILLYVPGWYMICQIVAHEATTIWGLWQVFRRFEITPHPLHPDRCGGLRAINNYVVGFTYVIALVGLGVVVQVYVSWLSHGSTLAWDVAILLGLYVMLGLACFFLPPWTAHTAMADAKHGLLEDISRRFQASYLDLTAALAGGVTDWTGLIDRVEGLHTLYQLTDEFPVWPFDTTTLRRFVVTILAPLVPVAVEVVVELARAFFTT